MPMSIEEEIFRLQITVNDVLRVQILESKGDFGCVEFGDRVWEALVQVSINMTDT